MEETIKEIASVVVIAVAIVTPAIHLLWRIAKLEAVDAAQEFKINIIWNWVMRGAEQEAIAKGLMQKNSPLKVTDKGRALFEPVAAQLRAIYRRVKDARGSAYADYDLQMAIWAEIGPKILEQICSPLGLDKGGCLLTATEVAKEPDPAVVAEIGHRSDSDERKEGDTELEPK